jgi:hypothetical protein
LLLKKPPVEIPKATKQATKLISVPAPKSSSASKEPQARKSEEKKTDELSEIHQKVLFFYSDTCLG